MRDRGKLGLGLGLILCGLAACGQDLVLPQAKPQSGQEAPSEGFTGAGGVADEAAPSGRLPVAGEPIFTTFGGAGGDDSGGVSGAGASSDEGGDASSHPSPSSSGSSGGGSSGSGGVCSSKRANCAGSAGSGGSQRGLDDEAGTGGLAAAGDASGGAGGAPSLVHALIFSEYVDGSSTDKALEIVALEASSLEGCELQTYVNGSLKPARVALHGELGQSEVQVLCSTSLLTALPEACDLKANLTFNGDDALALSCDGELLDVIGQLGVDPGAAWGAGATLDHTLRRRCEVLGGRRDGSSAFEIDPEWLTLAKDTFEDLGERSCTPPVTATDFSP